MIPAQRVPSVQLSHTEPGAVLLVNGRPAVRTRSPAPTPSGVSTASCPARSPPPNGGNGPTATPPSQPGRPPPPASPSRPPRQTTSPRSSPRPARSTALGLYLWLVAVTGVRRGELCGLQIRDIDLDRGLVHVAFNYVVRGGQRVRKYTKTHQDRWLAIDPATCALIANYLDEIRAGGTYQRGGQDRARPGYSGSDSPSRNPSSSGEPPPTQRGPPRSVPRNIGWSPASLAGTCPHAPTPRKAGNRSRVLRHRGSHNSGVGTEELRSSRTRHRRREFRGAPPCHLGCPPLALLAWLPPESGERSLARRLRPGHSQLRLG